MPDDAKKLVGNNYVVAFDLGNGRSIQVNGNFYVDDDKAAMDHKLDAIIAVLERQRAKTEVDILGAELKERQKRLGDIDIHIAQVKAQIGAQMAALRKPPNYEARMKDLEAALATHELNRKRMELEIEEGASNVEAAKQKAA